MELPPDAIEHGPGIVTWPVSEPISSSEEWMELLADGPPCLFDTDDTHPELLVPKDHQELVRNPGQPYVAWAPDGLWHMDRVEQEGKLVTVGYWHEASSDAGKMQVLDTAGLYEAMQTDEFFALHGLREAGLQDAVSMFDGDYSTFINDILLPIRATADPDTLASIDLYIQEVERTDPFPPVSLPLLGRNSFSGESALLFDGGVRCYDICDGKTGLSYEGLLKAMRRYIAENEGELKERGAIHTISPEPGRAFLISREGTLHRGLIGEPEEQRTLFIGTIATARSQQTGDQWGDTADRPPIDVSLPGREGQILLATKP
ncbi:MAG TPA: hypothetical protein VK694_04995 [Verrucomicrobiae bacterium]|nr:hypothetical protein [Verrucomicrobiae bacterium]